MRRRHPGEVGLRLGKLDRLVQTVPRTRPAVDVAHAGIVRRDGMVGRTVEIGRQVCQIRAADFNVRTGVLKVRRVEFLPVDQALGDHVLCSRGHELHEAAGTAIRTGAGIPAGLRLDDRSDEIGVESVARRRIEDLLLIAERIDHLHERGRRIRVQPTRSPENEDDRQGDRTVPGKEADALSHGRAPRSRAGHGRTSRRRGRGTGRHRRRSCQ